MPTTYQPAPQDVLDLIAERIDGYYPVLRHARVTIDVLMADNGFIKPAIKVGGYPALACVSIVPLKQRALGRGDALMLIDQRHWEKSSAEDRAALIDHELEHIQVKAEKVGKFAQTIVEAIGELGAGYPLESFQFIGIVARDDLRRPKLKLKLHDFQIGGFRAIALRHRERAPEVRAVRACRHETTGQYAWDWEDVGEQATVAPLKPKKGAAAKKTTSKKKPAANAKGGATLGEIAAERAKQKRKKGVQTSIPGSLDEAAE